MDSGILSFCIVSQINNISVDVRQLGKQFCEDGEKISCQGLVRAGKKLGFKSRLIELNLTESLPLSAKVLPVIAETKEGEFLAIVKRNSNEQSELTYLVHDPLSGSSKLLLEKELLMILSGQFVMMVKRENIFASSTEFNISWFLPVIKKYKHLFYDVLIASLFLQLFALLTPLFFQVVMDKVLVHHSFDTLNVLALGFLVVIVFDVLLGGIRTYIFSHTTTRIDVELGAKLYNHLLTLPLRYFETRQVGQTVARVHELDSIRQFITGTALTLCIDLLFTVVFFGVMYYYSPTLTWVVLASIPAYVLLSILITPPLRARVDQKFKQGAINQSFLVESISGIETLKSCSIEPQMQRSWEDKLANYVSSSFKAQQIGNISGQIASLINKLTTLGIIWFGARLVMNGELTVGQLVAFNMIAGHVSGPILKLVNLWQDFQQAQISVKRLGDILNVRPEITGVTNASTLSNIKGKIEFRNVSFRYDPNSPLTIDSLEIEIGQKEIVGVVGRSGSGKSTLTKLLQKFYIPDTGQILVDNVDISSINPCWLRQNIGIVPQDTFLYNKTVRENIALTFPAAPIEKVIAAAKLSAAHEFIIQLSHGYDTVIDEQGSNLSGGQKQRIAIARALITNPKILIFDEATSALDAESEQLITESMPEICQGRTVVIVAHKLSSVQMCDRLIVLDKGRVVEVKSMESVKENTSLAARLLGHKC